MEINPKQNPFIPFDALNICKKKSFNSFLKKEKRYPSCPLFASIEAEIFKELQE